MYNYKDEVFFIYVLIYDMFKKIKFMLIIMEILDKNDWYIGLMVVGIGDKIFMLCDCIIV